MIMKSKSIFYFGGTFALSLLMTACAVDTSTAVESNPSSATTETSPLPQKSKLDSSADIPYSGIYEYTPKGAPDHLCVIVDKYGFSGGSSISCFPVSQAPKLAPP